MESNVYFFLLRFNDKLEAHATASLPEVEYLGQRRLMDPNGAHLEPRAPREQLLIVPEVLGAYAGVPRELAQRLCYEVPLAQLGLDYADRGHITRNDDIPGQVESKLGQYRDASLLEVLAKGKARAAGSGF